MKQFLESIQSYYLLILAGILLVFSFGMLFYRKYIKTQLRKNIDDVIVDYNSVKSIPISFKLNKAIALAKINEGVEKEVKICNEDFDLIQGAFNQFSLVLADTDDALLIGNIKLVRTYLLDLEGMLEKVKSDVNVLDQRLDVVLEDEAHLRTRINEQKELFRVVKEALASNQIQLLVSGDIIDQRFIDIEKQFSTFEEWMFVSEFNKSRATLDEIADGITGLRMIVDELPEILMELQGVLPKLIEEVNLLYSNCVENSVYVQHLQTSRQVEMIQSNINEDLKSVEAGDLLTVKENIEESRKSLNLLLQQLEKELHSYAECTLLFDTAAAKTKELKAIYQESYEIYDKVSERFDFAREKKQLDEKELTVNAVVKEFNKIEQKVQANNAPSSKNSVDLKEFQARLSNIYDDIAKIKRELDNVRSDEDRAQKQLMKLYLIMNEMRVKIQSCYLPSISEECAEDMRKAYDYIETIQNLLKEEVLNVILLNVTLDEGIDYIYKLYNNVNNLVGMAIMVENAIVFGNRYRSSFPDIDSDLTKSELCFRNGEYTEALRVAIHAVEKMHPGSYESLIRENTGEGAK